MTTFAARLTGAAMLDVRIYEEVEADHAATGQAILVVVLSSLAAGVAPAMALRGWGLLAGVATALVGWLLWTWITYFIGTRLLPGPNTRADWGELLRTTGFASAPGILRVLAVIPLLGWLVYVVVAVWMLVAYIIAVRQALDYTSTGRAALVSLLGWVVYALISVLLAGLTLR
jgi:drug/metabolite transporter (DMT)-like permease